LTFSQHSLDKLEIYGISREVIVESLGLPLYEFQDVVEGSRIKVVQVEQAMFVLVVNAISENVITIYRTDVRTVSNRREANRWV
jgi:hypothetical protein